jgi:tetratricopeptide (TPR) repeat protein
MQYHKFTIDDIIIEFHNNWLGEETVSLNGQIVSKKSSILGTNHHFTVQQEGKLYRFVLSSKVTDMMQVALDLRRNGQMLYEDIIVRYGSKPKSPPNKSKKHGLMKLNAFEVEEALADFRQALDVDPDDPEIWFHLACAHSLMENAEEGFKCLKTAIDKKLQDRDMILKHEMLAFLRINEAFDGFLESNFTTYEL